MWHEGARACSEELTATAGRFANSANVRSASCRAELCRSPIRAAADHVDARLSSRTRNAVWVRS